MKTKLPTPQKLPSGMYRCQVMVNGNRESVVDADPNICQAKAVALKAGMEETVEQRKKEKRGKITLKDAIEKYIASRENVLSPSTIYGYKDLRDHHFQSLMCTSVCDIDEIDLQVCVNEDAKRVSAKTIKNALGLISAVIAPYKELNYKRIKLPQRKRKEHAILSEESMMNLFEAIQGNVAEVPILLAVWLGMRRSEIMGLCWDSVDFKYSKIKVQRTYVRGEGGFVLRDEMKTEASRRTLECPGYILSKLDAYQPKAELRTGRIFNIHPNTIYSSMKRVCAQNGIDFVGVHGLRHTNASVMASLDVIDRVTMSLGGWSTDVTMKQVYQHVFKSDKDSAILKRDAFFGAISGGENPKLHTELHTCEEIS